MFVSFGRQRGRPAATSLLSKSRKKVEEALVECAATAACPLTGLCDGPCVDNDAGARAAFAQDCAAVLAPLEKILTGSPDAGVRALGYELLMKLHDGFYPDEGSRNAEEVAVRCRACR